MSLTDEAIEGLKGMILSGRFGPGERLPVEKDLAEQLGLSRSSLREAVRVLTFIGVLKTRRGDGTYVTSLEPGVLLEATGTAMDLFRESTLAELLEVRRFLEPPATAIAAAKIGAEDLERLRECLGRIDAAGGVEELVEADDEFHAVIARSAGNSTLASLLGSLSGKTLRARVWRALSDREVLRRTKLAHHEIYNSVAARDPERARAAAAAHVFETEHWFRKVSGAAAEGSEGEGAQIA